MCCSFVPVMALVSCVTASMSEYTEQSRPSVMLSGVTFESAERSGSSVRIVAMSAWRFGSNLSSSLEKDPRIAKPVVSWPRLTRLPARSCFESSSSNASRK